MKRLRRLARALSRVRAENASGALLRFAAAGTLGLAAPRPLRVCGRDLLLRPSGPDLDVALATLGNEFRTLARIYPPDAEGLIVDAGGFIGTAALAFAAMYPRATVVTIEPSSANLALLARNVAATPTIRVEHAALVAQGRGEVPLYDVGAGDWGFTLNPERKGAAATPIGRTSTVTFADLMAKYRAERMMIVKLDVEGAERELLADPWWVDKTGVLIAELHEAAAPGAEAAFARANAGRSLYDDGGEKRFSVDRTLSERA